MLTQALSCPREDIAAKISELLNELARPKDGLEMVGGQDRQLTIARSTVGTLEERVKFHMGQLKDQEQLICLCKNGKESKVERFDFYE